MPSGNRPPSCARWPALLSALCFVLLAQPSLYIRAATAEPGEKRNYDLPAGPAEQTFKLFSQQSGKGIVIGADAEKGVRTKAVTGVLTAQEAITRLLAGTGLVATRDEKSGAFAVRRETAGPNGRRAAQTNASDRPNGPPPALAVARNNATTGRIAGRVYNPATGAYVRSAEVRLGGTNRLAITEQDGSFVLDDVPAGAATLVISFTGYPTVTVTLDVLEGRTATREIALEAAPGRGKSRDEAVRLQEFVVSSEREGNAKAIMDQRRSMNISTSVASDVFGDVAEGNVGEFLKYIAGVDIEYIEAESRGPRLGGLSPEYVGVTMDGARLAGADALASYNALANGSGAGSGERSVGFEMMSINNIESIEINRTSSADMDADAPAGNINLKTKRAFERKGRRIDWQVSLSANGNDLRWDKTHRPGDGASRLIRPNIKLDYSDVFLGNRLGINLGLTRSQVMVQQQTLTHTLNRQPTAADPRPVVITNLTFSDGPKFLDRDTASLTADFKAGPRLVLSMSAMYNTYLGWNSSRTVQFNAASNNTNAATGRATVLGDGLTEIRTNGNPANTVRSSQATGGLDYEKYTRTVTLSPKFEYKVGRLIVEGRLNHSQSRNDYGTVRENGAIRNESAASNAGIDFVATRSDTNSAAWTLTQLAGPNWSDLASYRNPGIFLNDERGAFVKVFQGDLNARYAFPWAIPAFIKLGGKLTEERRRTFNRRDYQGHSYIGPGGGPTGNWAAAGFPSQRSFKFPHLSVSPMPMVDREAIAATYLAHPEWFVFNSSAATYYTAYYANERSFKQEVPAVYGLANARVGPLRLQAGLRWERTQTAALEFDPLPVSQVVAAGFPVDRATQRATTVAGIDYQFASRPRVMREGDYENLFPSATLKYSIRPNLHAELGYSHAISRPPINALSGVWTVDDENLIIRAANPNLKPEISDNFVSRLAWYFEPVGSFTLLAQQNDITNLRETAQYTAEEFGYGDDPEYSNYDFITTRNGSNRFRFRNMEVGYNQQLSFIPGFLGSTNVNLSYSRSYASRRRPGAIPHKFTSSLGSRLGRLDVRLSGIWMDDAEWTSTTTRFQRHNFKMDLNASVRISRRMTVFVHGRNILNDPRLYYDRVPGTSMAPLLALYAEWGSSWVLGVKGHF